jgi:succinate-semialdehyde dehydrogenase / glutarate-semialdehyde dehydrogenase
VVDEFTEKFAARMDALVYGHGIDAGSTVGPLVSRAQQQRVTDLVQRAVDEGASVVVGGSPTETGFGYRPTVLAGVSPGASILGEEVFGPVAPIVRFDDEAEMLAWANGVEHGLASYVYSGDIGRGIRVAEAFETGMVGLNRGMISDPAAPFGGYKASGIGREGAHDGLLEFLETKYVAGSW